MDDMKKWKIVKLLANFVFELAIIIATIVSFVEYIRAELIVDKVHYGFILLAALIYFTSNKNKGDNNCCCS